MDLRTVREPGPRLIGNCAIEADLGGGPRVIAGFENHGGRTYLGPGERRSGAVLAGHGNNGDDGTRAYTAATWSAPTSTARSCRRTSGWPTA